MTDSSSGTASIKVLSRTLVELWAWAVSRALSASAAAAAIVSRWVFILFRLVIFGHNHPSEEMTHDQIWRF